MKDFKPSSYNSLSAYLVVDNALALADMLSTVFDARTLRKYLRADGRVMHMELMIDDTVLMLADSTPEYPARSAMLHLYVPDVYASFEKALHNGGKEISKPVQHEGDPDIRGSFYDISGNFWSISTQRVTA